MTVTQKRGSSLTGKNILLGITGSIAAFKAAGMASTMVQEGAEVTTIMTRSASRFVAPLTFAALTANQVHIDMFAEGKGEAMAHINLARTADVVLIAPATAHTIARLAHGFADDLLSTAVLAAACPVVVCPAMNSTMLANTATQSNLARLRELGYQIVDPDSGVLACGDEGSGRLPDWDVVREAILACFAPKDLSGEYLLITAGPTRESLDPARYLSNRSSGKMGYALARTATRRGACVTLISGPVQLTPPPGVKMVNVLTAREMHEAVMDYAAKSSIIVKAAAVADFRPHKMRSQKIKKAKAGLHLELVENSDILADLGRGRTANQLLVGFAAESSNHETEGQRKLREKNVDLMVVNDIMGKHTGFDVDTNQVTLITKETIEKLELMSKEDTADQIWDKIVSLKQQQTQSNAN